MASHLIKHNPHRKSYMWGNTPTLRSSLALTLHCSFPPNNCHDKNVIADPSSALQKHYARVALYMQSVRLIITGKSVWVYILTRCTFLSTEIATGSDCGSGTPAPLQEFIKSPMLQASLTSCSLACYTAEDQYDLTAAACSFET